MSENLELYNKKLRNYQLTLEVTAGCGGRAQSDVDAAFEQVQDAYSNLSDSEKQNVGTPPRRTSCANDGTFGMSSGMAGTASWFRR